MPVKSSDALPDYTQEIRRLRSYVEGVAGGLRRQAELLSLRGITPPPVLMDGLDKLNIGLQTLEQTLTGDDSEIEQLRSLAQTYALINSSLDVDVILGQAMDEIISQTGAERGFILLTIPDTDTVELKLARGMESDAVAEAVSRTILQEVISTGRPILTENAANDPIFGKSDTVARYNLRSILCVPMIFKEHVEGAIYVDNRFRAGVFTEKELTLLTAFANQTAVAVNNARLFQQVQATLGEITHARDLMENVFSSIESGVIAADSRDTITTINRAAGQMLAIPPEQALGKALHEVLPPIQDDFASYLRAAREAQRSVSLEAATEITGRRAVLNLRLSPLQSAADNTQGQSLGVAMVLDDLTAQRERDETLGLLQRYLPPGMIENIHQIADLAMGGERREVTCVFVNTANVGLFSPDLRPQERMELLNIYLETATQAIQDAQGVIDKYMGSEIMILFNTQLNPQIDHALRAVEMTLALRESFRDLYRRFGVEPDVDLYTIGVHSGVATLGNVGSHQRRNFTALGDTINLTKRLQEGATTGQIIVSGDTVDYMKSLDAEDRLARIHCEERGALTVRGRQRETRIFEVFAR